jgi:transcriptional regulator with GAF, ATPase, and Fis domain
MYNAMPMGRRKSISAYMLIKGRIGGEGGAAKLLGVPTSTLNSRIKRLGFRKEHF